MLYPFVITVPVVAYGNADRIVRHPDALLVIHIYVVDCIAVHGVISVEVGHDVRFGPVSVHIHLVDTCTVCRYQYVFFTEGTDTVDADIYQAGFDVERLMKVQIVYIDTSLKGSDKDFVAAFMKEQLVDLQS